MYCGELALDSGLGIRLIVCMAINCKFIPSQSFVKNHPWLAAFVLHGSLLLLAVFLLPIGYGVCDDVIIEWLIANDFSSWWYTGQLHPYLSFSLGWVWEKFPGIAWYSLLSYGMTCVSWIMICGGMFRAISFYGSNSPSNATLLYVVAGGGSLFFACDAYIYMQYTQLALTLLLAGVVCLVFPFSRKTWLSSICAILFILLGLAWREKSVYILYPFLMFQLICFLYKYYRRQCPWRSIGKWVTVFVVVTLAFGTLHLLQDKILQENEILRRSYENIELQSVYMDYPDFSNMEKDWKKLNLSEKEIRLMKANMWFLHSSPAEVRLEKMARFHQEGNHAIHGIRTWAAVKLLLISKWAVPVIMAWGVMLLTTRKSNVWSSLLPLVLLLLLYVYIGRVAGRVLYGTYLTAFIFLIISPEKCSFIPALRSRKKWLWILTGLLILETVAGWFLAQRWNSHLNLETNAAEYRQLVSKKDRFYISNDIPCLYPRNPFLHTKEVFSFNNSLSPISWLVYLPVYEQFMLDRFKKGCWFALLHDPSVYYLTEKHESKLFPMPFVLQYMSEKYAVDVKAILVEETERHMVWKLKSVSDT